MSTSSKIQAFKDQLVAFCDTVGLNMYHNESLKDTGDYGVWYELGVTRFIADDRTAEKAPELSVQLWTTKEYSDLPEKMEEFFDSTEECYWENQTYADYDSDNHMYHYGWTVVLA